MARASPSRPPEVTVFSDYICPFCYIGKFSVEQLQREFQVDVEWRNIEIHPETPLDGIPRAHLGVGYYSQAWLQVERLAEERGIEIRQPPTIANSSLALIAAECAREAGRFQAFHEAVFRAYWLERQDIGDLKVLFEVANQVGINSAELKTYVTEGGWDLALDLHRQRAAECKVSGVPTVVIGEEIIVGAQPYGAIRHAWLTALEQTAHPSNRIRTDTVRMSKRYRGKS